MEIRWALALTGIAFMIGLWSGIALERACQRGAFEDLRCTPTREQRREAKVVQLRMPALPLRLEVEATAYNSEPAQTDRTPWIAAWGDDIRHLRARGINPIAVSRDLLPVLPPGSAVRIGAAEFVVADTMAAQWRRRVDLWMPSRGAALRWGTRRVTLERIDGCLP
ncbi:MAG: hypothetical protein QN174_07660 [Armatimonadota bacterium]|nr:hypothetical protein [Armatimonadota bacterium]